MSELEFWEERALVGRALDLLRIPPATGRAVGDVLNVQAKICTLLGMPAEAVDGGIDYLEGGVDEVDDQLRELVMQLVERRFPLDPTP